MFTVDTNRNLVVGVTAEHYAFGLIYIDALWPFVQF